MTYSPVFRNGCHATFPHSGTGGFWLSGRLTRVMVIGNAGGGKSTLCGAICAAHGLAYLAIDKLLWKPNWVRAGCAEYRQQHTSILAGDRWLIGGYGPMHSVGKRLDACDSGFGLDTP